MQHLRGVNLGGWLVLERWITPSVFHGTVAEDEYGLCKEVGDKKHERLKAHRDSFITMEDFAWIEQAGLNSLRIPVPYWVFEDHGPFVHCVEYLDFAMEQATQHNLKVILDLHAAPGSQNGQDHSGRKGSVSWHQDMANIEQTVQVVERLSERYAANSALAGIELLNEPASKVPVKVLTDYYHQAYEVVRKHCGDDVAVIISDRYGYLGKTDLDDSNFVNVWADTHLYQAFALLDRQRPIHRVLKHAKEAWKQEIADIQQTFPLIIGEWSLALDKKPLRGLDDFERDKALQAYGRIQQETFSEAAGWFYWTYKTEGTGAWNFRDCTQRGWLHT
jgi:glucan 1,3-beta-glucosidase